MLVPFNNTDKNIKAVIRIEEKLNIPDSAVFTDAVTGKSVPCKNSSIEMDLESRSYGILIWNALEQVKE